LNGEDGEYVSNSPGMLMSNDGELGVAWADRDKSDGPNKFQWSLVCVTIAFLLAHKKE